MHDDLVILKELGDVDTELKKVQRGLDSEAQRLADAKAAVEAAEAGVEAAKAEVASVQESERELNRALAQYQRRRTSAVRVLEGGGGDAEAAQRQLEQCDALIDKAETEALEALELLDGKQEILKAAKQKLTAEQETLQQIETDVPAAVGRLEARQAELRSRRAGLLARLPKNTQRDYEHILSRKGSGVAEVRDKSCSACHHMVPAQQLSDLKRGLIEPCRNCQRWLVLAD